MQVILLERVEKLGQMGDEVRVKDGFARNFLLPKKKALRATKANREYFQTQKAQLEAHNLKLKGEAEEIAEKLIYYPTVTREPYRNRGRLTDLIESGRLFADIGLPPLDPEHDRAMICGSPSMLAETSALLDARGFAISPSSGVPGDYVIERAFVER